MDDYYGLGDDSLFPFFDDEEEVDEVGGVKGAGDAVPEVKVSELWPSLIGVSCDTVEDLRAENDRLREEHAKLLDNMMVLNEQLKDLQSDVDPSIVTENVELQEELKAYSTLVQTLRDLSGDESQQPDDGWLNPSIPSELGDATSEEPPAPFAATPSMLRELAEEADMKVLSFLAVSQTLQGGNWVKAKYPVGSPRFFQDLKFHYQLGHNWLGGDCTSADDRAINMRFDMFFPGFPASVVAEIVWRMFCSQEHSRAMTRSMKIKYDTIHESCDPKTGDKMKLFTLNNPIIGTEKFQQTKLMCRRTRRQVARSTLTIPRVGRSRRGGKDSGIKRLKSDDDIGNVETFMVSQSSTKLFPVPHDPLAEELRGQVIRGSFVWQDAEGARIVCLISYPSEFLYNGQHTLAGNATYAFNNAGNVTKWFAKLVEHAAGQFIQYMVEETLHRRGRGVTLMPDSSSSADEEDEIRVVEISTEATQFLKGLADSTRW